MRSWKTESGDYKDRSKTAAGGAYGRKAFQEKMLEHQIKTLNRKERTHRLSTRGAMLESHLPHPESVTDEQVSTILKVLFCRSDTKRLVAQVLTNGSDRKPGT